MRNPPNIKDQQTMRRLYRCSTGQSCPGLRFELDLRDFSAEVVFAWARYLYVQEDLSLVWPCNPKDQEQRPICERFWTELMQLSLALGDEKLHMYAQDVLVGSLSDENWVRMAVLAEQVQCRILSEASLMMGLRLLLP